MHEHVGQNHQPSCLKKYLCKVCGKGFVKNITLSIHVKDKHLGNKFTCFICTNSQVYSRLSGGDPKIRGLAGHLYKVHDIVISSNSRLRTADTKSRNHKTRMTFRSNKNQNEDVQKLIKSFGYKLDKEYQEEEFALNYNKDTDKTMLENND